MTKSLLLATLALLPIAGHVDLARATSFVPQKVEITGTYLEVTRADKVLIGGKAIHANDLLADVKIVELQNGTKEVTFVVNHVTDRCPPNAFCIRAFTLTPVLEVTLPITNEQHGDMTTTLTALRDERFRDANLERLTITFAPNVSNHPITNIDYAVTPARARPFSNPFKINAHGTLQQKIAR